MSVSLGLSGCHNTATNNFKSASFYLTSGDRVHLLEEIALPMRNDLESDEIHRAIFLKPKKTLQKMKGFGYTLTGGSARLLSAMSSEMRKTLIKELFSTDENGIGISYLRLSIGSSDLDPETFSYNDLPLSQTDIDQSNFDLGIDREYLIPILLEILSINPSMTFMGSPWSAPVWMKDRGSTVGGSLKKEYYDSYALYFVRYIQQMAEQGIVIDSVTVQNEPLHDGNNPSMYMTAEEQNIFVQKHLGPAFSEAGINTKIIIYDHNADRIDYPLTLYNDKKTNLFVAGAAFHLYGGSIEALSEVHEQFPDKSLYFTEQWVGGPGNFSADLMWQAQNILIGASNNWAEVILEWNLASDPKFHPHTVGGCTRCLGAITIAPEASPSDLVKRNVAYYLIAHASKFVPPGSFRIESKELDENLTDIYHTAFLRPDDSIVVIILNNSIRSETISVQEGRQSILVTLPARSLGTLVLETK